jgi:hypothetical protein
VLEERENEELLKQIERTHRGPSDK